jgi:hypothetical protein
MSLSLGHDPARLVRMLERTAEMIAHHPDFPGKGEAVQRCRDEVDQWFRQGVLTEEQRERLLAILDGEPPRR